MCASNLGDKAVETDNQYFSELLLFAFQLALERKVVFVTILLN